MSTTYHTGQVLFGVWTVGELNRLGRPLDVSGRDSEYGYSTHIFFGSKAAFDRWVADHEGRVCGYCGSVIPADNPRWPKAGTLACFECMPREDFDFMVECLTSTDEAVAA